MTIGRGVGWAVVLAIMPLPASAQSPARWVPCSWREEDLSFGPFRADTARVRCGSLEVPENPLRPAGRTISIAFAIVEARHATPGSVPLVYLQGGPGLPGMDAYSLALEGPGLAEERDVILFDPRGTGRTGPEMCPWLSSEEAAIAAADLTREGQRAALERAQRACWDELARTGIDPGSYDMDATVRDLEALRRALGLERWNLLGRSYGGALAQRVMLRQPESVRSAILVSPVPLDWSNFDNAVPGVARTLARIFRECAADAACGAAFPDPEGELLGLYDELVEAPWSVPVDTAAFPSGAFTINPQDLMSIVDDLLYADWNIGSLPSILRALAEKDERVAALLVEQSFAPGSLSIPAMYSVWCRDAVSSGSSARWSAAAEPYPAALRDIGFRYLEVCPQWPVTQGPEDSRRMVGNEIPTLVLSGGYDHVTSVADVAGILESLTAGRHIVIDPSSHTLPTGPTVDCVFAIMRSFLEQLDAPPEASCAESLPAIRYSVDLPPTLSSR